MVIQLIVFMLKLGFAGLLLRDRKDETRLWCAVCLLCAGLSEVSAYVGYVGGLSVYIAFTLQVLQFVGETGMSYAFLMAGIAYCDFRRVRVKRMIGVLLLLPPLITAVTLQDGILRLDNPNSFFLTWTCVYLIAAILLMLGNSLLGHREPQRRKKASTLFIIVPAVIALLLIHYLSEAFRGWSELMLVIVVSTFVLAVTVISRVGILGLKLRLERKIAARTLSTLAAGTSMLGHSLKNRLTNIDLLANRIAERSDDAAQEVQLIHQEIGHLYEMVGRIQHHTEAIASLSEEAYSLNELLRTAIDACAHYHSGKKAAVRFRPDMHVVFSCDKAHLLESFISLLHNALDAVPAKDGAVEIRLARAGRQLKLEFTDNGQGIAPEHLPMLGVPFYSTRTGTGQDHCGLGLAYCSLVVEKHNGKLVIESKPGQGTTVRILLPMKRVKAIAATS